MFQYRVTIAYEGSSFHGWQSQSKMPSESCAATVQSTVHQALRKISRYQDCAIYGCSRTDAGVHAQGQVAKICIPKDVAPATLLRGLNCILPDEIRILDCERCDASFNPQVLGTTKEYHYYFSTAAVPNPVLNGLVSHVPGPVDLLLMARAAQLFVGEHDFVNFCRRSSTAATTLRRVAICELLAANFVPLAKDVHYLRVVGQGFLKQMVRYLAGTIFDIGRGSIQLDDVRRYLQSPQADKLSAKAKPGGLHLIEVRGFESSESIAL